VKKFNILLICVFLAFLHVTGQDTTKSLNKYIRSRIYDQEGREIVGIVVPGKPPDNHREPVAIPNRSAVTLSNVPAFDWSFGCSATSAAMAAGYYDNNGYPDMYTGPTNGGIMPMDNSIWGYVVINGETRAQCPLSATRETVDGRASRGHVDDYWILYNDEGPDPFITNGWTEHTYEDCTGDFMGTNQSELGNVDGGTIFYNYSSGAPLYDYTGCEPDQIDGCHGFREFYESRGYTVTQNYSQYIYGYEGNTLGFTFNQYKQEIDNGRPVLIQVEGHTMLGYGYDDTGTLVYLHDTWDYSSHTMTWGSTYSGMQHYAVCVVELEPSTAVFQANFSASTTTPPINTTVTLNDLSWGDPTSWLWSISPGTYTYVSGSSSSSQNPQVQFTAADSYTVTLYVSNGVDEDSETKTNYINAVDCSNISFPFSEDFSGGGLPDCWLNVDNQGNGQIWQFNNPGNLTIYTSSAANGFAILDSDHYGSGNSQNADLVTPVLDISEFTNVNLYFEHYFRSYSGSSATLSYSINGGNNWTDIQTWTASTTNAATFNQDVSSQVAGQSNVRFKWNYTGTWGYYWAVDDISITGSSPGLWRGNTSTDWNTASNWDDGVVPSSGTNVTISPDAIYWPTFPGDFTLGSNCNNLTLPAGSEMTANGDVTINSGCSLVFESDGLLNVNGDWNNSGIFTPGQGTVKFIGTGTSTISEPLPAVVNYVRSTFTKSMTALTSPTLGPTGDDGTSVIPIGFTFNFGGTDYTNARICTNGWLSLDQSGSSSYTNEYLFTTTVPNTSLAPWWDDLTDDGTSTVNYKTTGTEPDRVFTAEWYRVKTFSTVATARISFQVKLYETSNIIEFHYGTRQSGTASSNEGASIGIEDATGGSGHFIEATTGSTTTGVTNLKSATQWPTVNYRFTPPASGSHSFQNLALEKTGYSLLLEANLIVGDTLTLTAGDINCGSHTLDLGTSETITGTLVWTSGNIIGNFRRWVAASTTAPIDFPIGTSTGNYNARVTFTNNTGGTLTANFEAGDPGNNSGFPLTDGPDQIEETGLYTEGSWTLVPTSLSSTDYTLELSGTGFSSAGELDETVRILKRPDAGGNWTLDGIHVTGSPPIAKRSGLSGFSRFALAKPGQVNMISGNLKYYNQANTPLISGIIMKLFQDDTQVGSDFNVTDGTYEFSDLTPGIYEIRVSSSQTTEGSINTTDAAQTNYWGAVPYTIEKVRFYAGDVTGASFFINSTDAMRIQQNFVNGTAFDKFTWAFWKSGETISGNTNPTESYPIVNYSGGTIIANIFGLCAGDFNRSFVPGLKKNCQ